MTATGSRSAGAGRRAPRRYSDQERAEAVRLVDTSGLAAAAAQTGIPKSTLTSWRREPGMPTGLPVGTGEAAATTRDLARVAGQASAARRRERRERWQTDAAEAFMEVAQLGWTAQRLMLRAQLAKLTGRALDVDVDLKASAFDLPEIEKATSAAFRNALLLAGEATDRIDFRTIDPDQARARIIDLTARLRERAGLDTGTDDDT